jgi:hypothetical protein
MTFKKLGKGAILAGGAITAFLACASFIEGNLVNSLALLVLSSGLFAQD